jgi:hypothetical protein
MKTYEVELKRTSFVVLTVEAENEDDAEAKAWEEIQRGEYRHDDAFWDTESIENVTKEKANE